MSELATIPVERLSELDRKGDLDLIDVRTPAEFREVHVPSAKSVPLDSLDPRSFMTQRSAQPDTPLYVICKAGSRGAQACKKFQAAGYTNVINVEGGTDAWSQAGLPVVRGKKAISLERQVRIVAGTLVFISGLLAILVHPYFAGIATFVGAGLMFAGITDSCAMGMLLAKMPWNQVPCDTPSCSTSTSQVQP